MPVMRGVHAAHPDATNRLRRSVFNDTPGKPPVPAVMHLFGKAGWNLSHVIQIKRNR